MFINEVTLYGNLTKDVELKSLPSGTKVAQLSMATNRSWKDATTGEKKEEVTFHNVTAFGKQAEVIAQYVSKGKAIYVKGRLVTRSWEDKDTKQMRYKTEIVLESFQFGVNKREENSAPRQQAEQFDVVDYPDDSINPEDIPF